MEDHESARIPEKLIGLAKVLHDGFTCAVTDRRRRNNEEIHGGHRCEARILHVGIPVFNGHRLGDEEDRGWTQDGQQMGLYKTTGGH